LGFFDEGRSVGEVPEEQPKDYRHAERNRAGIKGESDATA
jgi:hypothetical protein